MILLQHQKIHFVSIDILPNDVNPDEYTLAIIILTQPPSGEENIVVNRENPVDFTPIANFNGVFLTVLDYTKGIDLYTNNLRKTITKSKKKTIMCPT